jgi:hypothetical protein
MILKGGTPYDARFGVFQQLRGEGRPSIMDDNKTNEAFVNIFNIDKRAISLTFEPTAGPAASLELLMTVPYSLL